MSKIDQSFAVQVDAGLIINNPFRQNIINNLSKSVVNTHTNTSEPVLISVTRVEETVWTQTYL